MKNVVFDYGQVLITFDPQIMIAPDATNEADAKLLETVLFDRLYWDRLDDGTLGDEALLAAVKTRLPVRLHQAAERIYRNWYYRNPPIEGMKELILQLKEQGMKIYLLSNISRGFASHAGEFDLFSLFDGCVFSATCGFVKPHPEIFEYLCKTYRLEPKECLFIDDRSENIAGARACGMEGYRFDGDVSKLKAFLDARIG